MRYSDTGLKTCSGANRRLLGWVLAAAMLGHGLVPSARAQAIDDIELRVIPDPRGCVTEAALRGRVASFEARASGSDGLALVVDAAHQPEQLEVRRDGIAIARRTFESLPKRCSERLDTIALVMTLAIEHAVAPEPAAVENPSEEREVEPTTAPQAPVQSTSDAKPSPPEPSDEQEEPPVSQREPALRAVLGGGAAYGLLPEVAGLLVAGIELPGSVLRLGLGAVVSSGASTELAGGTARTRVAGARGYGCMFDLAWAMDVHACAGLILGVVASSGRDYAPSEHATGTLLAPFLRLGARYPAAGLFSIGLALEGFAHLVRPELQVSGRAGNEHSQPPVGTSLSIEGVLALD